MTLYEHESLIIFDEVQLFPKARQAIKHLVLDGKYSYLETGSLISIKKNVNEKTYSCKAKSMRFYINLEAACFFWDSCQKTQIHKNTCE